jgi:hypothetical protein
MPDDGTTDPWFRTVAVLTVIVTLLIIFYGRW